MRLYIRNCVFGKVGMDTNLHMPQEQVLTKSSEPCTQKPVLKGSPWTSFKLTTMQPSLRLEAGRERCARHQQSGYELFIWVLGLGFRVSEIRGALLGSLFSGDPILIIWGSILGVSFFWKPHIP